MLSGIPEEWGPKFECDGGAVTRTHTGPSSIHFTAPAHMALIMLTAQPRRQIALNSDRKTVGVAPVGSLEIIPVQNELYARWMVEKQNLLVAVDANRLVRLAGMEFDNDTFELHPPKLGTVDDKAHTLAHWMRQEIENVVVGRHDSLDALVTIFATHLLRNYSSLGGQPSRVFNGGLPQNVWRRVNDFIQANIAETLSLEQLSSIAHLSPSHFTRAFRQSTGQSPHQFVLAVRIAHARKLIIGTDMPFGEIAKSAGFANNSHMTALLKRTWSLTPSEIRRKR